MKHTRASLKERALARTKKKYFPTPHIVARLCWPLPVVATKGRDDSTFSMKNFLCVDLKKTFQGIHLVHVFIIYCYLKKYKQILIHLFEF